MQHFGEVADLAKIDDVPLAFRVCLGDKFGLLKFVNDTLATPQSYELLFLVASKGDSELLSLFELEWVGGLHLRNY